MEFLDHVSRHLWLVSHRCDYPDLLPSELLRDYSRITSTELYTSPVENFLVIKLMHLWSLSHFLTRFYISPYNGDFLWSCLKYAFDHLVIFLTNSLCIPTRESLVIAPNHFSQIFWLPQNFPSKSICSLREDDALHPLLNSQNQLPPVPSGSLHYHVSTTPE